MHPTRTTHVVPPAAIRPVVSEHLTGAQAVVRSLEESGVEVAFGIPGGAVLPLYDPLLDSTRVRHVLVRHEQGAGHAATGYAQATGRAGVCIATSGPGATNLVTPIADAHMDSVPLVAITGQVGRAMLGTDGFQEADICGITMPITKHNFLVTDPGEIGPTIASAFHLATTGRPGPGAGRHSQGRPPGRVHVDLAAGDQPARLPSDRPPAQRPDRRGRSTDRRRPSAGAVRRRRGDQGRRRVQNCASSRR